MPGVKVAMSQRRSFFSIGRLNLRRTSWIWKYAGAIRWSSIGNLEQEAEELAVSEKKEFLEGKMRRMRRESFAEKCYRYRGVILVVCMPLALISLVLVLMPSSIGTNSMVVYNGFSLPSEDIKLPGQKKRYAVVFDAGSSGSRVHVFCFDSKTQLVKVGDDLELFKQKKPGLSHYAADPKAGAESLQSLLDEALSVVPPDQRSTTPVRLGATAGLRLLPGDRAKELLQEVDRSLEQSPFMFKSQWVNIIDGTQEGSYQWVTVNYLLGNLGKGFDHTVGIVDLGGGSVQIAYAISDGDAVKAPTGGKNEEAYVQKIKLLGVTYNLYVHSYLNYGLYAARAEVLKLVIDGSPCPCLPKGFNLGPYQYGDTKYTTQASDEGADYDKCRSLVVKALNTEHACTHMKCTFGGIWSGGGGDGFKKLFVASFFFDRAVDAGIIKNELAFTAKVKPSEFEESARRFCAIDWKEEHQFLCLDLVYQYSLLVTGFQLDPEQELMLVKKVDYKGSAVEAAWPLGSAIELLSGQ